MADTKQEEVRPQPALEDYASENTRLLDEDPELQQVLAKAAAEEQAADQAASASVEPAKEDSGFSPWEWVRSKAKKASARLEEFAKKATEGMPKVSLDSPQYVAPTEANLTLPEKLTGNLSLKGAGQAAIAGFGKLDQAVTRGVAKAGNEMGKTILELAGGAVNATGAYKVLDEKGEDEFRKWYAKSSNDWTVDVPGVDIALLSSKEHLDKWAGPHRDGALGFVEGVSQFAAGMATGGALLKGLQAAPLVGPAFQALDKTKLYKEGAKGLIADMAFFNPYEERLSNMIADGPSWFSGPLHDFIQGGLDGLKSDPTDGKASARIKAGAEGFITGQVMDRIIFVAKLMRAKNVAKVQGLNESARAAQLDQLKQEFSHLFESAPEGPAKVSKSAKGHQVDVNFPEFDISEIDMSKEPPHVAGSLEELKPEFAKVEKVDGKNVVRAYEPQPVGPPKVYDIPLDGPDELKTIDAIKELRRKAGTVDLSQEAMNGLADGEWKVVSEAMRDRGPSKIHAGDAVGAEEHTAPAKRASPDSLSGPSLATPNSGAAQVEAASSNMAVKNVAKRGKEFVGPEQQKAFFAALKEYGERGDPRHVVKLLEDYGFNPGYVQQPEHVINQIKAMVDASPEASKAARNAPRSWEEVRHAAEALFPELSDDGALQHAAQMFGGTEQLPEKMLALRAWMWFQAKQVGKLSTLATEFPENALLADQHMAALNTLFQVHAHVTGSMTKAAQTVNIAAHPLGELTEKLAEARKSGISSDVSQDLATPAKASEAATKPAQAPKAAPTLADKLKATVEAGKLTHRAPNTYDVVAGLTKREILQLSKLVTMADGNLDGMLKLITGPKVADLAAHAAVPASVKKNWKKHVNTARAEFLLSAPTTHLGNIIANAGVAVKRPVQYFWAGVESGDHELAQEGKDMLGGLFVHWWESAKLAGTAFKQGKNLFDASSSTLDRGTDDLLAMDRANLKWGLEGIGNGAHMLFRMPSRMLMSADEFFKQLSGRAYTRAQVMKQARAEGVTSIKELRQRSADSMKIAFDPQGGSVFPDAIKYAKEATFTEELGPVAKKMQEAIHATEEGRFILPFFKTPMNIAHHAWEEAPGLNLLNKKMVEDLNAGGRRAALARAKADWGAMMYGMAAWLTMQGKVTGSGPMDPDLRKQWIAAGNQPYSLRIGGGQFSFRRGDPFTTSLGLVADIISMSGELDENSHLSSAAVAMAVMANNVTSKTFMAGLSDFLDAVGSGTPKDAQNFLKNSVLGTAMPNVATRLNPDDTVREARGVVDGFKARCPGLSEGLPPRRNIFGEKVMKAPGWGNRAFNPFSFMGVPGPANAQTELLKLGKALPMPPETWADGKIDLTDSSLYGPDRKGQAPYDRWLEMMSKPPWGGEPLRVMVENLIHSDAYKSLKGENAWGPGGARHMLVSEMIRGYQDAGKAYLLQEYPSLFQNLQQYDATSAAGIIGGKQGAQDMRQKYEQMFKQ